MPTNQMNWSWDLQGDEDPVSAAVNAPRGAIYRNNLTGVLHVKTGTAATAWSPIAAQYTLTGLTGTLGYASGSTELSAVLDPGDGNISYDFTGVKLVGIDPHRQVPLNILAGSGESNNLTITGASYFEGLLVRSSGSDTAFIAQNDQEIVLKNTTFNGAGQYAYDFLNVSGCILHLGDESRLQRTSNAAIRVNGNALTIHVDGARAAIDYLGAAGFVGGSIDVIIGSSSARVVDTATNTVSGTIAGLPGGFYNTMALQPGTNELWFHYDAGPNFVGRIDTSTDTYIA